MVVSEVSHFGEEDLSGDESMFGLGQTYGRGMRVPGVRCSATDQNDYCGQEELFGVGQTVIRRGSGHPQGGRLAMTGGAAQRNMALFGFGNPGPQRTLPGVSLPYGDGMFGLGQAPAITPSVVTAAQKMASGGGEEVAMGVGAILLGAAVGFGLTILLTMAQGIGTKVAPINNRLQKNGPI